MPLRKVCRRPETDYRLQQLHADQQKNNKETFTVNAPRTITPAETMHKPINAVVASATPDMHINVSLGTQASILEPKKDETSSVIDTGNANVPSGMVLGGTCENRPEAK